MNIASPVDADVVHGGGVPLFNDSDLALLEPLLAVSEHPLRSQNLATLSRARRDLARMLLACAPGVLTAQFDFSATGKLYLALLKRRDIRAVALDEADASIVAAVVKPNRAKRWNHLFVALLYRPAHEVVRESDLLDCPYSLENRLVECIFTSPLSLGFDRSTLSGRARLMEALLRVMHRRSVEALPGFPPMPMVHAFIRHSNIIDYLAGAPSPDILGRRGEILTSYIERSRVADRDGAFEPLAAPRKRIRIGVLVWNMRDRVETRLTLAFVTTLDRSVFSVHVATASTENIDALKAAGKLAGEDVVIALGGLSLAQSIDAIRKADLDILVAGNNALARPGLLGLLLSVRLARRQVGTIAMPSTSGSPVMDYFLTSAQAEGTSDPAVIASRYTEKPLIMDGLPWCFDGIAPIPKAPAVGKNDPALVALRGLRTRFGPDAIICISGAQYIKYNETLLETWAKFLIRVPSAVLLLYPLNPDWQLQLPKDGTFARIRAAFVARGVDGSRVAFAGPFPDVASISVLCASADLYLDSFPYSGCASILDPMLHGLPAVSLAGPDQKGRQGAAQLEAVGLGSCVASDPEDYIRIAAELAENPARRNQVRDHLLIHVGGASFLDVAGFGRRISAVYSRLYRDILLTDSVPSARPNHPVRVLASDDAAFVEGWHTLEHFLYGVAYRWSLGAARIEIAHAIEGDAVLALEVARTLGGSMQGFEVVVGKRALPFQIRDGGDDSFTVVAPIPADAMATGPKVVVDITAPFAVSPSALNQSPDIRVLGVAVTGATLVSAEGFTSPEKTVFQLAQEAIFVDGGGLRADGSGIVDLAPAPDAAISMRLRPLVPSYLTIFFAEPAPATLPLSAAFSVDDREVEVALASDCLSATLPFGGKTTPDGPPGLKIGVSRRDDRPFRLAVRGVLVTPQPAA